MQAMAKAGKIICFVHELPTEAAFHYSKDPQDVESTTVKGNF